MHTCPLLPNTASEAAGIAAERSASAKMTSGDLPPISNETRLKLLSAEARTMERPVAADPVKPILSTSGWAASAAPAVSPYPVTMLMTPGGRSNSWTSSPSRSGVSDASSEGFSTIVQPVASAGAIFQIVAGRGLFWTSCTSVLHVNWRCC
jgi:hypothetical protein